MKKALYVAWLLLAIPQHSTTLLASLSPDNPADVAIQGADMERQTRVKAKKRGGGRRARMRIRRLTKEIEAKEARIAETERMRTEETIGLITSEVAGISGPFFTNNGEKGIGPIFRAAAEAKRIAEQEAEKLEAAAEAARVAAAEQYRIALAEETARVAAEAERQRKHLAEQARIAAEEQRRVQAAAVAITAAEAERQRKHLAEQARITAAQVAQRAAELKAAALEDVYKKAKSGALLARNKAEARTTMHNLQYFIDNTTDERRKNEVIFILSTFMGTLDLEWLAT